MGFSFTKWFQGKTAAAAPTQQTEEEEDPIVPRCCTSGGDWRAPMSSSVCAWQVASTEYFERLFREFCRFRATVGAKTMNELCSDTNQAALRLSRVRRNGWRPRLEKALGRLEVTVYFWAVLQYRVSRWYWCSASVRIRPVG